MIEKKYEKAHIIAAKHVNGYYNDGIESIHTHMYECCQEMKEWVGQCLSKAIRKTLLVYGECDEVKKAFELFDVLYRKETEIDWEQ